MPLSDFNTEFPLVTSAILNARNSGHLAHSYLINTDNPSLGRNFALALASLFSCQQKTAAGDSCGKCTICRQIAGNSYQELFVLMPTSKSRQIVIGKDDTEPDTMRWFQSFFFLRSTSPGGKKIGLIIDADCMNDSAQNSFLKTLEEPPSSSIFILITANPLALLPTLRSRCQNIMLLKNQCSYGTEELQALLLPLYKIQFNPHRDLMLAEECASEIIGIAKKLHDRAEEITHKKWEKTMKESSELEKSSQKQVEKRLEAAIEAEYLKMQSSFLSLFHTWFAQIYQLSIGISEKDMSNPELLAHFKINPANINGRLALDTLRKAENLLENLNWNVDEELAYRQFCLDIVLKK